MQVSEFYAKIGGDYADIKNRLCSDEIIKKFILKFENDKSYEELIAAVREKDTEKAIEAAHKLKGVAANLSFSPLYEELMILLKSLREEKQAVNDKMMTQITGYYEQIILELQEL